MFHVRDVFLGRFTQYFVLSLNLFERKSIEFVLSMCFFSPSGANQYSLAGSLNAYALPNFFSPSGANQYSLAGSLNAYALPNFFYSLLSELS